MSYIQSLITPCCSAFHWLVAKVHQQHWSSTSLFSRCERPVGVWWSSSCLSNEGRLICIAVSCATIGYILPASTKKQRKSLNKSKKLRAPYYDKLTFFETILNHVSAQIASTTNRILQIGGSWKVECVKCTPDELKMKFTTGFSHFCWLGYSLREENDPSHLGCQILWLKPVCSNSTFPHF